MTHSVTHHLPKNVWFDCECKNIKAKLHRMEKIDYKSPETRGQENLQTDDTT